MVERYRVHDLGPLTEIRQDRPGHVYVTMTFDLPGCYVRGHVHSFDHIMRVRAGALRCVVDGVQTIYRDGDDVLIGAGKAHELWSLASNTVAECDHEIRAENGDLMPDAFSPQGIPLEWVRRLTETWGPRA